MIKVTYKIKAQPVSSYFDWGSNYLEKTENIELDADDFVNNVDDLADFILRVSDLESTLDYEYALQLEIIKIEADVSDLEDEIDELQEQIDSVQKQINSIKDIVAEYNNS